MLLELDRQPMKVMVKYLQGHFYIINFGIYRWRRAAIPIFDILIGFGVMTERLNPYISEFSFLLFFFDPLQLLTCKNSKF